jgi:hypothetical protein
MSTKFGAWLRGSAWPFLKKYWKAVAVVAGAIVAVFVGKELEGIIVNAIRVKVGEIELPQKFKVLDDTHLSVSTPMGWQTVDLGTIKAGPPVKAKDVLAVQIEETGPAKVEVKNETIGEV